MSNAARIAGSTPQSVAQLVPSIAYQQTQGQPGHGIPRQPSYAQSHPSYASPGLPQTPSHISTPSLPPQANLSAAHPGHYPPSAMTGHGFPPRNLHLNQQHAALTPSYQQPSPATAYHPAQIAQRFPEVYVLPDAANAAIPLDIRSQYPADDNGKMLWFTAPPVVASSENTDPIDDDSSQAKKPLLKHSPAYIAARAKRQKLIDDRNSQMASKRQLEAAAAAASAADTERSSSAAQENHTAAAYMASLLADRPDERLSDEATRKQAQAVRDYDEKRGLETRDKFEAKRKYFVQKERKERERGLREVRLEGTVFRDDWDERY